MSKNMQVKTTGRQTGEHQQAGEDTWDGTRDKLAEWKQAAMWGANEGIGKRGAVGSVGVWKRVTGKVGRAGITARPVGGARSGQTRQ